MSAGCCRPQWRNLDYYNFEESTPPNSPWLLAGTEPNQPRKRKCTEMKTWSKRRMGAGVMGRSPSAQSSLSENDFVLKKTPWAHITDPRRTVVESYDSEENTLQPEYCLADAVSSQLSTDSGYCSSKEGENDSRGSSIAPTSDSPSPCSSINEEEDFQSTLLSEMTSNVPKYPRSLDIDQWSPQSFEDEIHETPFPALSSEFDSYFEELLDPQLNGSPEAESWPDDLTPDWLLDKSFNLLRPFKRSFVPGSYENTAQKFGNHYFADSETQSTLEPAGRSIVPSYELQNLEFFREQSKQMGCGSFPVLAGPDFGLGNTEYGNFFVRSRHPRREKSQTRRIIWPYPRQNKLQRDDILTCSSSRGRPLEDDIAIPEAQSTVFLTLEDSHTTISSPIMLDGCEADLESRVFSVLGSDPGLAQAVVERLKDQLPFISSLFCGADEGSVLGDSPQYSSPVYEHGSSRSPSATSSASQAKSSSTSSGMTPATSISSEKFGDEEDGEDKDSPSKDHPRKRQKVGPSKQQKTTGRRRLRCHFHAKCPITHNQKACVMSGWLSIHNLRGHYSSHHTKIRCNRCFGEFQRKTEKNVHQRSCSVNAPSPSFEVIDCDKLDELEECLGIFRSWQLETEEDQTMRHWILKYKPELSSNSTDDAFNARELAKWYRIWQTLYPALQSPVPSPCKFPHQDTESILANI